MSRTDTLGDPRHQNDNNASLWAKKKETNKIMIYLRSP
jgi:hypothetical protein